MRRLSLRTLRVIGIGALSVALTAIITQPAGAGASLKAGEAAKTTYKSPQSAQYTSDLKTKEAEEAAAKQVPAVYRPDLTAASQQSGKVAATLDAATVIRSDTAPLDQRISRLQQVLPNLTADQGRDILTLPDDMWTAAQTAVRDSLGRLQSLQVKQDELANAEALVAGQMASNLQGPVRTNAVLIAKKLVVPNYLVDEEATQAARNRAKDAVEPINYTVERDQVLVSRGQVITDFDIERLTAAGLTRPTFDLKGSLGIFLLILLFALLLLEVAPRFAERARYPRRMLALLTVLAIGLTLAGVLIVPNQPILAYVLPVAAPAILLAIFYGFTLAIVAGVAFAAFYALAAGGSFELFFIHLAAVIIGVLEARRINSTLSFLRAGALVGAVVFVGMVAFALLTPAFDLDSLPKFLLAAGLNGALTATSVFAGAAFLGGPLGIVTFLQLLELESPRHPLLRMLSQDMPNTYAHSLRIARLVEAGAEEIGADPLLARVQALFHDIGKSAIPEFFTENQEGTNPHDRLKPKESAEILRAHISEGLSLAQQHHLPDQVAAGIPEHHGSFVMPYFLAKARSRKKNARTSDFRYLGPKPQSRETALLMLADAAESASRSLRNPTAESIETLIQQLITERVDDGQLDEAPISTVDLTKIKSAFVAVLVADSHKRVSYPKGGARAHA